MRKSSHSIDKAVEAWMLEEIWRVRATPTCGNPSFFVSDFMDHASATHVSEKMRHENDASMTYSVELVD